MNRDISLNNYDLHDWIDVIIQVLSIIADRLHVPVFYELLGKKLICIDPERGRISNHFNLTFRDDFDDLASQLAVEWLFANEFVVKGQDI
jgi:exopolysaccharide biosynthesis predicted pyruvyltransferase EpsI